MALSETAKALQQGSADGVQVLRAMRQFIHKHDFEFMNNGWKEASRMEDEADTLEEKYRLVKKMKELNRDTELLRLYLATLTQAERRERQEKGGGAAFYNENKERIAKAEAAICQESKDWEHMQMALDELARGDE